MGRVIDYFDKILNEGEFKRVKGAGLIAVLCIIVFILGRIISWFPDFGVLEIVCVAILLAQRSLVDHVKEVSYALSISTDKGRHAVSMIVGRDTSIMDQSDVSRAAIESAAENFSDGVIAPAFWFAIAGLPGILFYKLVNTADSMIGHLTPKYAEFGWAAARLDDLLNWVPARLTGALFCIVSMNNSTWATMFQDAQYHRSPNAGWPQAAMAGTLDIALSGPRTYDGVQTDDPFVHVAGRHKIVPADIDRAIKVLWKAWGVFAFLVFVVALFAMII